MGGMAQGCHIQVGTADFTARGHLGGQHAG